MQGAAKGFDAAAFLARLGDEHGESLFDFLEGVQFWIKDHEGRYVRASRGLLENYGINDESQVIGRTDHDLFAPHLADQYRSDDLLVLSGQTIRDRIELVARLDHSTGWHITDKIPLRDREGGIIGTAGITRDLGSDSVLFDPYRDLESVVARIRARYAEPLDKLALARLLDCSVRSLERRFIRAFGLSVLRYQKKLRLHRACQRLVSAAEVPVTTIALEVGYGDHSQFTREFRRQTGVSPREYRRRWSAHARL